MRKVALFLVLAIASCLAEDLPKPKENPRGIKRAIFAKTINFDDVDLKTAPRGQKRFSDKNDFEVIYDASAGSKGVKSLNKGPPYIPPTEPPTYLPPVVTTPRRPISTPADRYLPIIETTTRRITTPGRTITYGTLPSVSTVTYRTSTYTYRPIDPIKYSTPKPLPPPTTTKRRGYIYSTPPAGRRFDVEDRINLL